MEGLREQEILQRLTNSFGELQEAVGTLKAQCTSLLEVEKAAIHYVEEMGICPNTEGDEVYCDSKDCAYCKLCRVIDESCTPTEGENEHVQR